MARSSNGVCKVCLSPYRKELVTLINQGWSAGQLYEKYAPLMNYTSKKQSLYILIKRHINDKHSEEAVVLPQKGARAATIENFGQRMLELGMMKLENATPENIDFKDITAAQKLVLDSRKLKLNETAFDLMMSKLFAPPELQVIEGEEDVPSA